MSKMKLQVGKVLEGCIITRKLNLILRLITTYQLKETKLNKISTSSNFQKIAFTIKDKPMKTKWLHIVSR